MEDAAPREVQSDSVPVTTHEAKAKASKKSCGILDPNHASTRDLELLPGIGPALAQRIAAARDEAPFQEADDLLRVKGIGPAKLQKIRPHLKF